MAEPKFYSPFAQNDNFDVSSGDAQDANSLFISNRIARGEHVTQENSGLTSDEWESVSSRFQTL